MPQPPQLAGSEVSLVQLLLQQAPAPQPAAQPKGTQELPWQVWVALSQQFDAPQAVWFVPHTGLVHEPAVQTVSQTWKQAPQLERSVPCVWTQVLLQH